jgi:hypothetical protein
LLRLTVLDFRPAPLEGARDRSDVQHRARQTARQTALDALNEACPLTRLSDHEHENLLDHLAQTLIEREDSTTP